MKHWGVSGGVLRGALQALPAGVRRRYDRCRAGPRAEHGVGTHRTIEGMSMPRDYSWQVETTLDPAVLRSIFDLYRPFRVDINFSSGFSTREFADEVSYPNPMPFDKLHYFESEIVVDGGTRVLDIGCNLGYYCHYFLKRGVHSAVGIEFSARLFSCATLLRAIAGLSDRTYRLIHGDFADPTTQAVAAPHGKYDLVLFLGAVNNIRSLTAALLALPALLSPGGVVVIEYLAITTQDTICRFHPDGFRDDDTHYWSFSETFLDRFFESIGLAKVAKTLEWENREVLGEYTKIMAIYRMTDE
jgi:SAM-dependent methyltransferase